MRRSTLLCLLLMTCFWATPASAREGWRGWCEVGNQSVVTSGISSTTKTQRSFPRCTVLVLVHGGGVAQIYSDNQGTVLANPFQANLDGSWIFFANDGRYDIQTSGANFPAPFTYLDILLCDPFAAWRSLLRQRWWLPQFTKRYASRHHPILPASPWRPYYCSTVDLARWRPAVLGTPRARHQRPSPHLERSRRNLGHSLRWGWLHAPRHRHWHPLRASRWHLLRFPCTRPGTTALASRSFYLAMAAPP